MRTTKLNTQTIAGRKCTKILSSIKTIPIPLGGDVSFVAWVGYRVVSVLATQLNQKNLQHIYNDLSIIPFTGQANL
jgi:hypothetical protein